MLTWKKMVRDLRRYIPHDQADAYYQLVYYPVVCASWMNKKFLYRDKAFLYAKQNRISAHEYAEMSRAAYDSIVTETAWFNDQLKEGKWKGIMSMKPRYLPVFQTPDLPVVRLQKAGSWEMGSHL